MKTKETKFRKSKKKLKEIAYYQYIYPIHIYIYIYKFISVVYANHLNDIIYYMFSTNTNINN